MEALELLGIALAPGAAIALFIYLKDKHEKEPLYLLFTSFLYGIFSILITLIISYPVNIFLILKEGDVVDEFIHAIFKVALIEEFSKFIFVRFILIRNKHFNEPFDGIVYAVMVGMGFATLENILYTYSYGWETGLLRMFTAVPAHATFAVLMGYYIGILKFTSSRKLYLSVLALGVPTLFHGLYDYFWFIAEAKNIWTGIWMFAIVSLVAGIILSRKAIILHQQASPFIASVPEKEEVDTSADVGHDLNHP